LPLRHRIEDKCERAYTYVCAGGTDRNQYLRFLMPGLFTLQDLTGIVLGCSDVNSCKVGRRDGLVPPERPGVGRRR
jgi:hypothetical protein